MLKLIFPFLLATQVVHADVKISQLPLGNASTTSVNDSFPYVDSVAQATKRLKLSDLINLPTMSATFAPIASPTFTGVVSAPSFVGTLTGTASNVSGVVQITHGGTGQTVANDALNALLPTQTSNSGKFLKTDGTNSSWTTITAMSQLTGDVTAGPGGGSQAATVAFVGGSSAANVHSAELIANTATNLNTPNAVVGRDGSGNFSAGTITANLTGTASGNEPPITGGTTLQYWRGDKSFQTLNTAVVPESSNLYFTTTRARNSVSATAPLSYNSGTGDFSITQSTTSTDGYLSSTDWNTFNGKQNALSFGNLTDLGTDGITVTGGTGSVIGSGTSIAQHVADATHNGYLSSTDWGTFNTTSGSAITALTSDVSASGPGSATATIQANVVSNSKLAQMAAHTFKGNNTGSTANAIDLTATQLTAELNAFVGDSGSGGTKGLVPAPASGDAAAGKFLKADGSFAVPSGTALTVGTIDSQAKSADGAVTSSNILYLQTADATHPGLASATGNLTDVGTDGITVTGGTDAVIGSGTSIDQHVADVSHNGYLSSTDWSTFNGKQAAGSYLTALTGDATASGPGSAALTLATVNSNVGSFGSSTAIPSLTVNGKGLVTAVSTNAVVAPAGTLTGTTLASNVVTSSLTTVGTIGSGTWQGTAVGPTFGGTGLTSYAAGQLIYANATNSLTQLSIGPAGSVLQSVGGFPAYGAVFTRFASYTISSSGWGAAGTYQARSKRLDDCGVFSGSIRLTTAPTGTFQFSQADFFGNLSLTLDTSKLPGQTDTQIKIGGWEGYKNGAANYSANMYVDTASGQILFQNGSSGTVNATSPTTWGNTDSITWYTDCIPITGW